MKWSTVLSAFKVTFVRFCEQLRTRVATFTVGVGVCGFDMVVMIRTRVSSLHDTPINKYVIMHRVFAVSQSTRVNASRGGGEEGMQHKQEISETSIQTFCTPYSLEFWHLLQKPSGHDRVPSCQHSICVRRFDLATTGRYN